MKFEFKLGVFELIVAFLALVLPLSAGAIVYSERLAKQETKVTHLEEANKQLQAEVETSRVMFQQAIAIMAKSQAETNKLLARLDERLKRFEGS